MKKIGSLFTKFDIENQDRTTLRPLFKKQLLVTALSVCFVVLLTLTYSYAVFSKTSDGNEYNVVKVGELQLSYVDLNSEGNVLQLADSYPISDTTGVNSSPYRFSVENTGSIIADYTVKIIDDTDTIDVDGCGDKLIDTSYLKYKFDNADVKKLKDVRDDETGEYIIATGTLKPYESNIHEIRIWIDEKSPNSILGTHYHGKVIIDIVQNNATDPYTRPVATTIASTLDLESKVDTSTKVDFSKPSSETNGRGIYKYSENNHDIYYWRGNVEDNHVIFGGYCWEMIRTTSTGGVKMIYDGEMVDGKCNNTGSDSTIGDGAFNDGYDDNAYVGYMYGLIGVEEEIDNNQCIKLNNSGTGALVGSETNQTDCLKAGGKWATTAYEATHTNIVNSTIKNTIDNWFKTSNLNISNNLKKIEDAVYCNDRSIDSSAGSLNGWSGYTIYGYGKSNTVYSATSRLGYGIASPTPSLECKNANDRFTVSIDNGNGELTYPVGLITADEVALAGGQSNDATDSYINKVDYYWTLTPYYFNFRSASNYFVYSGGYLMGSYVYIPNYSIRPVITLAGGVKFTEGGDGTKTNPYVVED